MAADPSIIEGAQIAVAGGLGGALRAFLSPELSFVDNIITIGFGVAFSHYFAPVIIASIMTKPTLGTTTATGFIVGFIGMSVAYVLLRLNWRDILLRLIPAARTRD